MASIGALLIVCCFVNSVAASIMNAGMKRHNKCIILAGLLLDVCLAGVQLTLGISMHSKTVPNFNEAIQLDCLLKVPVKYTQDECLEYLRSDRYAGMMLVWRSYNFLSLDYTKYSQRLVQLEKDGMCCGFGPPKRCTGDSRDFPRWANKNKVGFGSEKRYTCGREENWYEESYFCAQYVDETAVFLEIGGCKYDYPMGDCMDVDVGASTRGCASVMETHMTNKIVNHALSIMGLSSLLLASVFSGCCMFWKRAYIDAMPDYVDRHVPWDSLKDKLPLSDHEKATYPRVCGEDGAVKLDPLGMLIMGEMPEAKYRKKIMPI
ncbi:unnamed protein product [Ascophyllum nodosum]